MSIRTTIILLALLLGLAAYLIGVELGRDTPPEPNGQTGDDQALFTADDIDPKGATKMTIKWEDGSIAVFERGKDDKWMQTAPVRFPMHSIRFPAVVSVACYLRYVDKFLPDQQGKPGLAALSLDKPRVTIHLTGQTTEVKLDRAGQPQTKTAPFDQTIHLGATLTGSRGYVQLGKDAHVYVVNHDLHSILLKQKPAAWRIDKFETPNDAQADRIALIADSQPIDMVKIDGTWMFAPPLRDRVAPKVPDALLRVLGATEIGRYVDENAKDLSVYGLDKPQAALTVHSPGIEPRVRTLRIGNAADPQGSAYHASWSMGEEASPVVFTVMKESRARFMAPTADDLRDPRITPIKAGGVKQLTVQLPGKPAVILEKAQSGWSFAAVPGQPRPSYKPDADAVGQLIDAITTTGARYYETNPSRGEPLATVALDSTIAPVGTDTLAFYPAPKHPGDDTELVMVFRNNETTGYLVAKEKVARLFEPVIKLRDRQVIDLKPESLTRILIKRFDKVDYDFVQFETVVDGKLQWQMVQGQVAQPFEKDMLVFLVREITKLRAETWVAETGQFGPRVVTVTVNATGDRSATLTVDLDTRHAKIDGVEGVFRLEEKHRMMFDAEYRPRIVLPLASGEIGKVSIIKSRADGTKADPFTFTKDDLNRYLKLDTAGNPEPFAKVNPQMAAAILDNLTPLRAWRLVEAPADLKASDALTALELTTRTGQRHTIAIGFKDQPALANIKDKWFTLHADTLARLTVEPKEEEKDKDKKK